MSRLTQDVWFGADAARYPNPNACKFISGDDFLALAMKAYIAAGRKLVPELGQPWNDDGLTWCNAESFFDALLFEIGERLRVCAIETRHLAEVSVDLDYQEAIAEARKLMGGPGRKHRQVMAHGCAAPLPAVGPAPEVLQSSQEVIPADPLFVCPERQDLRAPT